MSGPEKIFASYIKTSQPKTFNYSDTNYSGRRHSTPLPLPNTPSPEEFAKWDLIGYHGTSIKNSESLISGLDPKFIGSKNGLQRGRGFYTTPDYHQAMEFASNLIQRDPPQIFGAYTRNINSLKPEIDYTYGAIYPWRKSIEIVLKERVYSSIIIRTIDARGKVALPRHHEAPF
jgi:hypothetical protein